MSKFIIRAVLVISIIVVTVQVAGCSSPLTPDKQLNMTEGVAFDEIKVMVFQPPA